MKIKNQKIYGGNQQFADKIINQSSDLSPSDKELIELIHLNASSETEREELINSLKNIKSTQKSEEDKQSAWTRLKGFLSESVSQGSKVLANEIISKGIEFIKQ